MRRDGEIILSSHGLNAGAAARMTDNRRRQRELFSATQVVWFRLCAPGLVLAKKAGRSFEHPVIREEESTMSR